MTLKRFFTSGLALVMLLTMGAGCFGGGNSGAAVEQVELNYWRVFDDEDAFRDIINNYEALHPNVTINYRKLRAEEYDAELIRAFAEGNGPDIFSVHNTKLGEWQSLMKPMPTAVNIAYLETVGTLRKETIYVNRQEPTITQKSLKQQYVDVVPADVIRPYQADPREAPEDRVFGLPLAVDSMVLFYNKDLLNAAGIAEPPATWEAFQEAVAKLTVIDAAGNITQSGAALGTTENVERSADLISVLMLQNGTVMADDRGNVFINDIPEGTPQGLYPAVDAIRFYTDFANPTKEVYTWNDTFPGSFEAFVNGQTALFFGYSYHLPFIAAAAPKLNYAVANLPQIGGGRQVNYANYWVESVAKNTAHADYAWDFVEFAASAEQVQSYLDTSDKPTALRSLINTQLNDEIMGVFAAQVLTAESWYRGGDADAMEKALNDFADNTLAGVDPLETVNATTAVIRQTY
jgi:multiple sugar transport system substrate-binding protein